VSVIGVAQSLWLLVAALGLALSVSYAGLPVLGQSVFVAVGGYGVALLGPSGAGLPLGVAAGLAVLGAAALGYLTAFGLSRLDGAYLALATWALAWLAQRVLVAFPHALGGSDGVIEPVPAHLISRTLGLEITLTSKDNLCLAAGLCVVVMLALIRIGRGPGGLDLAGLRESPEVSASLGVPTASLRRAVLTATAALGAVSGAGSTMLLGVISPSDVSPLLSLQLFVAVLIGGTARWWGPVLGVLLISTVPAAVYAVADVADVNAVPFRGVLTAALLLGVVGGRALWRRRGSTARPRPWPLPLADTRIERPARLTSLSVEHAGVSYASVLALDDVSLTLHGGQVHALVGPNGSGKSTLLDVLAGALDAGDVRIAGKPHRAHSVQSRVLAGVVRTPQRSTVLSGLSPARQVALGARRGASSTHAVIRHLCATPRSRLDTGQLKAAVAAALHDTGLSELGDVDPSRLTTGERQLLQIARAVATGASVFLCDEPAAGMTSSERQVLQDVLRGMAAAGVAVLVVEHDMRFVRAVADWVTVLDAGRVIASGGPAAVHADPAVRDVFLGSSSN
jgi:branched-chain amino acid transport system permease protein